MREVKRLIALRHEHSALRNDAKIIFVSSGYPLIYRRTDPSEIILVIINPSQTKYSLPIDITGETIYSTGKGEPDIMRGSIIMPPESAAYIKLK